MRRVARILGIVLGALVLLVVVAIGGIWLNAGRRLNEHVDRPVQPVTVARTQEQVERGRYMVATFPGCIGCHASNPGANPPVLDGNLIADLKPLGDFYAPNLTPGGRLREWSDGEIVRAIREGISKDGRGLVIMPAGEYRHLSDSDVQSIVAYLRSQPAVQKETPLPSLTFLGRMLLGTGQVGLSIQERVQNVSAPPRGATPEYGRYLAQISGCQACHGANLDGENIPPGPPKGPNLRVVKGWTDEQFLRAMREGVDPSGRQLSEEMPWREYGKGTEADLRALYGFLRSLP